MPGRSNPEMVGEIASKLSRSVGKERENGFLYMHECKTQ
jgi:hypothetical protein